MRGVLKNIKKFFKRDRLDILTVHYTDPRFYPTEISTYNILTDKGFSVEEICISDKEIPPIKDKVEFIIIGERKGPRFNYILYPIFAVYTIIYSVIKRPKLIIAYETFSFMPAFISSLLIQKPILFHIHDLQSGKNLGLLGNLLHSFELKFVKYTSLLSMPEKNRMSFYQKITTLPKKRFIVYNAVDWRQITDTNESLKERMRKEGYNFEYIVFRHGGFGNNHSIKETVIASKFLSADVGFVFAGYCYGGYRCEVEELIERECLQNRVLFLGLLPRDEILKFLPSINLGLAVYKPLGINSKFYSTGSVKLAEYIAYGIPAVVNDNKIMRELNEKVGSFVFADPYSPESIASAVREVIDNPEKAKKLRENARRAFETFYNFEYQFEPVLKEIQKWIRKKY